MTGAHEAKQALRRQLLAARRERSPDALQTSRRAIVQHVGPHAAGVEIVAAYVPLRTEPGSFELLEALHAAGSTVLVPITLADRDLDWARWTPGGIGTPLGVEEISRAGLVIVPALAVAADGTRLGRGGGSYDRALARCAADTPTAALLFEGELMDELPRDPWDVPVGAAVTPAGWHRAN